MDVFEVIEHCKLVPVATIENSDNAIALAKTLEEAGLPIIEVTFRTEAAEKAILNIAKEMPNILVGAGTILKVEQIKKAVNAGAKFIVTPGFNPTVVDYCLKEKILIIPGLNTPTMVEWGLERGLKIFKFFPADLSGGPKMLKTLAGPYSNAKFIPTGGINTGSLIDYLKLSNVIACAGSWIVKKELISSRNYDEIKRLTEVALSIIKSEVK
ncbi:MAG: bifunctional 4-hydroxy-2-oxoglutarate aldolase/2-dehydro-3-deoxy-phosphogluconate aldolase [Candidatus Hodarchaeota archaeon]